MIKEKPTHLENLISKIPEAEKFIERGVCERCGKEAFQFTRATANVLPHVYHVAGPKGCRAATWTPEDGWDESIPRHWYARLKKETSG